MPGTVYATNPNPRSGPEHRIDEMIIGDLHTASAVLLRSKCRPLPTSCAVLVVGMVATFVVAVVT